MANSRNANSFIQIWPDSLRTQQPLMTWENSPDAMNCRVPKCGDVNVGESGILVIKVAAGTWSPRQYNLTLRFDFSFLFALLDIESLYYLEYSFSNR